MNGINSKDRFSFAKGYRARTIFLIFDICCRKAPANRWQHPCWVMRIRHFWSAPTAIRRTWRNSRPQT